MSKISTLKGKTIDIFNLKEEDIDPADILISINNICRYGGRCRRFYSVGQHTLHLTQHFININDRELAKIALLHDACEAYIGDIIWPIKNEIPVFEKLETDISELIFNKYEIDYSRFKEFDKFDKDIVVSEMKLLNLYDSNKHLITHLNEIPNLNIKYIANTNLVLSALCLMWMDLLNEYPDLDIK